MARLNPYTHSRGYTLLELLVVMLIAGILLGMATLQLMPTAQSVLREEAQRLAFLMENGALSAQAGGQALAWSGSSHSYRFWQRTREGEWVRIERDELLHPRSLPETATIGEVRFNDRVLEPGALLVLSPELSAKTFRVRLYNGKLYADILGNGLGKVDIHEGVMR